MNIRHGQSLFALCTALLAACADSARVASPSQPDPMPSVAGGSQPPGSKWLPVGTRVPVGQAIAVPPEPYNPKRHGPALPGRTDYENLSRDPGFVQPPRSVTGVTRFAAVPPPPGTGDRGFYLSQATREWYGAYAVYDLIGNLGLPAALPGEAGVWVYAPTTMPAGGSCIEITQVYQRLAGGATTGKYFGVYDWCESGPIGQFDVYQPETSTFTNRYVRTYQGRSTFAVTIVTPNTGNTYGQCWYAHIYDYLLGGWEQRLQRCGTPTHGAGDTGWTMWESWGLMNNGRCVTLPSIRALDISIADPVSSGFAPFTDFPSDFSQLGPVGACWQNGTYSFSSPVPSLGVNTWRGNTPNP